jgi:HTH-type transcriptional regulator/antitoxin HigA
MEKAINIKELVPSIAIHPGEILLDELNERKITQKEFAGMIGMAPTQLNEIIKGKRNVTADAALLIGKALHMDAELWMNLQSGYELNLAKIEEKTKFKLESLDLWQMIKSYIPVSFFKKQGVLSEDIPSNLNKIKEIYDVKHFDLLPSKLNDVSLLKHYRKSEKQTVETINLGGWIYLAQHKAEHVIVSPFNSQSQKELLNRLRPILKENTDTVSKSQKLLVEFGIKLIVLPTPEKCAVDGVTFWSNGHPAIVLSLRYKTIGNFAFTLLHELGHVYLHLTSDNEARFIDDLDKKSEDIKEVEANFFANENLIDHKEWDQFLMQNPSINDEAFINFAKKQELHPGIIVGRYCHHLNRYNLRTTINKSLN